MKKLIGIVILIISLGLGLFLYYDKEEFSDCPVVIKEVTVRGSSMAPFINSDDVVMAYYNYYDCHDPLRNEIVLYDYSGNKDLLIKFIKAVPGDVWNLEKKDNGYEIIVNDLSLLNHEGIPYLIPQRSIKILELYVKDYPIIPQDTYLILGNKIEGSTDSVRFGLINKKQIIAKINVVDK